MTHEAGMRLGELEGIVGEEDGYSAESDAAILLQGLDIPDDFITGRWPSSRADRRCACCSRRRCSDILRHCCSMSRPTTSTWTRSTGSRILEPVRGHADRDFARQAFFERRVHAHRRYRLPDDHHLYRRLRRYGDGQDADPVTSRSRQRATREEDRAAERLHPALRRRHPREPGHGRAAKKSSGCRPPSSRARTSSAHISSSR